MFKKLHSNRDPKDTLLSEIKKEFGQYFDKIENVLVPIIKNNPRPIFQFMILAIVVSLILSFTVFRDTGSKKEKNDIHNKAAIPDVKASEMAGDGFNQILRAGTAIKQTIALKQEIESIIAKKEINAGDSLRLEKALDKLERLNQSIK